MLTHPLTALTLAQHVYCLLLPLSNACVLRVHVCLQVLGGQLVTDLQPAPDGRSIGTVVSRDVTTGQTTSHQADAVVFAIGITGMQKLVQQCRILGERQEFRNVMNLRAIDVIATRLW